MKTSVESKKKTQTATDKTSEVTSVSPRVMPGNVRMIHVLSLIEEIGDLGTDVHFAGLAEKIGVDVSTLPPVLDAAEMLGLIKRDGADIALTELGLKNKQMKTLRVILKEKLAKIEPFQTAVRLASKKQGTTAQEVSETLSAKGIQWHYKPELNEQLVKNLLIHWTIKSGLLSYNGKNGKFQIAKS